MTNYKSFQIKEMFDIHPTKAYKLTNAYLFDKEGTVPVVTNTSENNGRSGYSKLEATEHDIITFSDTANKSPDSIFFQEGEFIGYSHVQGMYPYSVEWTKYSLLYLVTVMRKKTKGIYDYYAKMSRDIISDMFVDLPVDNNGKLDYHYMEECILNLEKKGNKIFQEALKDENLTNHSLTKKEIEAVMFFEKNREQLEKIKAKKLFEVKGNPQLNKESFVFTKGGQYPYFTRTVFNNGILGYVEYLDEEHKILGNSIAVGMMGMKFFYMKHDFYAGQFTKTLFPKFDDFDEDIALYFVAIFNKNSQKYLGGLVRDFENLFYDTDLYVPMKDGVIDYDLIRTFIGAEKKKIVKMMINS